MIRAAAPFQHSLGQRAGPGVIAQHEETRTGLAAEFEQSHSAAAAAGGASSSLWTCPVPGDPWERCQLRGDAPAQLRARAARAQLAVRVPPALRHPRWPLALRHAGPWLQLQEEVVPPDVRWVPELPEHEARLALG